MAAARGGASGRPGLAALALALAVAGCRPGGGAAARDAGPPPGAAAPGAPGSAPAPALPPPPPPLPASDRYEPVPFDHRLARDPAGAALLETPGTRRVVDGVTVRAVTFRSLVWSTDGAARAVRLHAFLATPPGAVAPRSEPAVVMAHGLGAAASAQEAVEVCRNLDVVALFVSAPGTGGSEGSGPTAEDPRPIFATVPDARGSWLYAYAFALQRAVTAVAGEPMVDPGAIVLTGVSMGGVATLIANGVDDRIRGAMVVMASGGFAEAIGAGSWLKRLVVAAGGLTPESPAARTVLRRLDPLAYAGRQHGAVFMVIGAQDEFFPIDRALATYHALAAPAKSLDLVVDFDHDWYFGAGCPARCRPGMARRPADCPAAPRCPRRCPKGARPPYCGPEGSYDNRDNFVPRWSLLLRALVARHAARPPRPFTAPPARPVIERRPHEVLVHVAAGAAPRAVRLALSDNGGYTFGHVTLPAGPDGVYRYARPAPRDAILVAEVENADGAVATSLPELPLGFRPVIRPFGPRPPAAP